MTTEMTGHLPDRDTCTQNHIENTRRNLARVAETLEDIRRVLKGRA